MHAWILNVEQNIHRKLNAICIGPTHDAVLVGRLIHFLFNLIKAIYFICQSSSWYGNVKQSEVYKLQLKVRFNHFHFTRFLNPILTSL